MKFAGIQRIGSELISLNYLLDFEDLIEKYDKEVWANLIKNG
jgi:hypothetical protein